MSEAARDAAISLAGVRLVRGGRTVLDGVDLRIARGERVALLGANGAGKSSLLDVVLGLASAEGRVQVLGAPPPSRAVGYLGQDPDASLLPWLSVRDNVELPLRLRGITASDRARAFEDVRARIDPAGRIDPARAPRALSGGERQMVGLMRAWIGAPSVVVLDEPLSAIDPLLRVRLRDALARACAHAPHTTLIFVSHDLDDVAAIADRALVLAGSRVAADLAVNGETAPLLDALRAGERGPEQAPSAAPAPGRAPLPVGSA